MSFFQRCLACCWVSLICGPQLLRAQSSGNDVSSAIPIAVGQTFELTGDRSTRPHAVYSVRLEANQLFTMKITRLPPWTNGGYDTVARLYLYAPGTQTVRVFNPGLAFAEVGDYATTGVLNYYVAL